MSARVIDGKALAKRIRSTMTRDVQQRLDVRGTPPGLSVILIGENPASQVYVRNKQNACVEVGIQSDLISLPVEVPESEVLARIDRLNTDPLVHGILVQLPLPAHIDADRVTRAIDPRKDVDGFHPENVGLLSMGRPRFIPCTPLGVLTILQDIEYPIAGSHAVIVGRSSIVGRPMSQLLLQRGASGDATVTVCHSKTPDVTRYTSQADILIAAMGQPEAIGPTWVKPGAVVIDVGIHRRDDNSLCGDVQFEPVAEVASAITPVPGGVGPLTVTMLIKNTLLAARLADERGERPPL